MLNNSFFKSKGFRNLIFILAAAAVCAAFVLLTDFQSADGFYGATESGTGGAGVTLTVRCDKIAGRGGEYVPADGCIIPVTQFALSDGETVYDVLVRAVREKGVHMECDGAAGDNSLAYVKGINYIYEFDYGELSGWVYLVNGVRPSVGCGAYKLEDGDEIQWLYTLDLGKDAGAEVENETS